MRKRQYATPEAKIFGIQSCGVIMTSGLEYQEGGEGLELYYDSDEEEDEGNE